MSEADQETFFAGDMFVSSHYPTQPRGCPVVFVHGGLQTGSNWAETPDGRAGWAELFRRRDWSVHVVDRPGHGRSPWSVEQLGTSSREPTAALVEAWFTAPAPGAWAEASLHRNWPGSGRPGDAVFERFLATQVRSPTDQSRMDQADRAAGLALIDRIGPAVIVAHSRGAGFAWLLANARPGAVRAIVALEPSGPPFFDMPPMGTGPEGGLRRPWGLTTLPLHFDPPAATPADLGPLRFHPGEQPGDVAAALPEGPPRRLIGLADTPVLLVTCEASYHACYDAATARFLGQFGVAVEHLRLAEQGIRGDGHMMMLETNSHAIGGLVADWLDRKIR